MRAVNLLPPEHRPGGGSAIGRSGGAVYLVLGGLAGLSVLGGLFALADYQAADRNAKLVNVSREADRADAKAAALAPYQQFAAVRAQRVQTISSLSAQRIDWAANLRGIVSALPADVKLLTLTSNPAGASGASHGPVTPAMAGAGIAAPGASGGAAAPGPTVALTGCATSQTEVGTVVNRLRGVPGVIQVSLTASQKGQTGQTGGPTSGASSATGCAATSPQFALSVVFGATPATTASARGSSAAALTPAAATSATAPSTGAPR